MAWPKGKPRKEAEDKPFTLLDANREAGRVAKALAARRDACINEMLAIYVETYGPDKLPHMRRFLRDLIDGKPMVKPKPLRIPTEQRAA